MHQLYSRKNNSRECIEKDETITHIAKKRTLNSCLAHYCQPSPNHMVKRHLKMTQNLPLLNYITYEHSCNAIWQLITIASKISAHKVQTLVNHKHELHLWSLHFSSFRLCQVVFFFKFVCSIKEGARESSTEMSVGSLTQTTGKWSPRDAPRIAYTFPLKQTLIYCLEMENNSSRYEATLNSSRYETTLKTKRKL